ncbi:flagellar hook capping protein [Mariprofundus ferrooxydans]|nr:flagellar hook capping protein [Mariprofundus ferrooxydans]
MPLEVTAPSLGAQAAPPPQQDLGSKDVFLKMLVAQMQYQDPLNPTDSAQMSSDLAQFNMVEQQIDTNKYLEQIANSQTGSAANLDMASAGYLGHTVMINQSEIQYSGTSTDFSITLDNNAESVFVTISDSSGSPVRTMSFAATSSGELPITWDGRDFDGIKVSSGAYSINVQAVDATGQAVRATPQSSGVVEAVRNTANGIELVVNGVPTSLNNITEVRL